MPWVVGSLTFLPHSSLLIGTPRSNISLDSMALASEYLTGLGPETLQSESPSQTIHEPNVASYCCLSLSDAGTYYI